MIRERRIVASILGVGLIFTIFIGLIKLNATVNRYAEYVVEKVKYKLDNAMFNLRFPGNKKIRDNIYVVNKIYHDYTVYSQTGRVPTTVKDYVQQVIDKNKFIKITDVLQYMIIPFHSREDVLNYGRFWGVRSKIIIIKTKDRLFVGE